jgi:hypothetical protein
MPEKSQIRRRIEDTGIYQTPRYSDEHDADGEPCDAMSLQLQATAEFLRALKLPSDQSAGELVTIYLLLGNEGKTFADELDVAEREITAELEAPTNDDARNEAYHASQYLQALRHWLEHHTRHDVAEWAFSLGKYLERMRVRRLERFALTGRRSLPGQRKGGLNTRQLTADDEQLCIEMMREELPRAGNKKSAAAVRVAARLLREHGIEIGERTIRNRWNEHNDRKSGKR